MNNKNMAAKLNLRCRIAGKMLLHKKVQNVAFLGTIQNRKRVKYIPENNKG